MFVVLSGRATIDIEGEPSIEVGPGDVVRAGPGCTHHVARARGRCARCSTCTRAEVERLSRPEPFTDPVTDRR